MTEQTHEVQTIAGGRKWVPDLGLAHLPVTVDMQKCEGCGRNAYRVTSFGGEVLLRKS
jgi:hypothetical protein